MDMYFYVIVLCYIMDGNSNKKKVQRHGRILCSAPTCNNVQGMEQKHFFRFPKDAVRYVVQHCIDHAKGQVICSSSDYVVFHWVIIINYFIIVSYKLLYYVIYSILVECDSVNLPILLALFAIRISGSSSNLLHIVHKLDKHGSHGVHFSEGESL